MAQAGYCSECGSNVWLAGDGSCSAGHPIECISGVYEAEVPVVEPPVKENKAGLLSRLGDAIGSRSAKELTPQEIELRQAQLEHAGRVKAGEKELKAVIKTWDTSLKDAEAKLQQARVHGTRRLGSYGPVTLYEHSLVTPQGNVNLEADPVTASVDTAGALLQSRRSTLTRMAAGGLLLGLPGLVAGGFAKKKETQDTRELYLLVESATVASIVPCRPDDGARVRQLAASIVTASRGAPARAAERAQLVSQWTQQVEAVHGQRQAAIANAEAALQAIRVDTARVQTAEAAVAALNSQT